MAVDEIRQEVVEQELEEADDDDDNGEREQRGEKRQHQNEGINSGIHHSESTAMVMTQTRTTRKTRTHDLRSSGDCS